MAFKDRLKEARKNKDLTQGELGEAIGVAKSTIAGYETGNSEPDMSKIFKILDILEIDANFLWKDEMKSSEAKGEQKKITLEEYESDMIEFIKDIGITSENVSDKKMGLLRKVVKDILESDLN